jgi:hypothetical protein
MASLPSFPWLFRTRVCDWSRDICTLVLCTAASLLWLLLLLARLPLARLKELQTFLRVIHEFIFIYTFAVGWM